MNYILKNLAVISLIFSLSAFTKRIDERIATVICLKGFASKSKKKSSVKKIESVKNQYNGFWYIKIYGAIEGPSGLWHHGYAVCKIYSYNRDNKDKYSLKNLKEIKGRF